ncbi:hypothetical protein [uncultured Paraglaciecola sp.]|uniref:hypothetical protein n=1 Tax=uncultured Paraglaciecola sp. TaxID=1765024 RepID=UPI00262CBD2B|nr:hypothetical protein [uncultured Paraglaciecola sp.]
MITSIAIDRLYAYTLDTSVISRHQLDAPQNVDEFTGPVGAVVSQIMTTNDFIYALSDAGVFRRYNLSESWQPVSVPVGTTYLSSGDDYIYTLSAGAIWRQDLEGGEFEKIAADPRVVVITQIDHDEEFGYALLSDGRIWLRKYPIGSWFEYRALSNVIQIVAGIDFIYALNASGDVFRSKVFGHSGWEGLGRPGIRVVAIPSDHVDRLWYVDGDGLSSISIFNWGKTSDNAWIDADWIDADWILVA